MNTGPRKLLIDGEYDMVSRASADVDSLRRAHETPISVSEARAMLAELCERTGVTVRVRFGCKSGRASKRPVYRRIPYCSIATRRRYYRREYTGTMELLISLPKEPKGQASRGWGLRAGLVLHEFAHAAIEANRAGAMFGAWANGNTYGMAAASHGPWFTWMLDGLVADWKSRQDSSRQEVAA